MAAVMRVARYSWLGLIAGGVASACFNPLYEDNTVWPQPTQRYEVCCMNGRVDTCACSETCGYALLACANGACNSIWPSGGPRGCDPAASDGGTLSDGGVFTPDAGPIHTPFFAACCNDGKIDTCECFEPSCPAPFTPCGNATCLAGTAGGDCR
ncbi:MAG: hypothetical protein K1X64_07200 [Myxococcaceae bacterium]|nr:hypothetical protein [Myxococcaceae bacterium]